MKTTLQIDITLEQLLGIVRQLPDEEKLILTQELAKEKIDSKLTQILKIFQTTDLSEQTIAEEVEIVRQQFYDQQEHEGHL
jgi:predicted DNA-binding protein YlxM (UPF0122 family)